MLVSFRAGFRLEGFDLLHFRLCGGFDFHWAFERFAKAETAVAALSALRQRAEFVLLHPIATTRNRRSRERHVRL